MTHYHTLLFIYPWVNPMMCNAGVKILKQDLLSASKQNLCFHKMFRNELSALMLSFWLEGCLSCDCEFTILFIDHW